MFLSFTSQSEICIIVYIENLKKVMLSKALNLLNATWQSLSCMKPITSS